MKSNIMLVVYVVFFCFSLAMGFIGWKVERWINWKFGYGSKVEPRIEQLEQRVTALERLQLNNVRLEK